MISEKKVTMVTPGSSASYGKTFVILMPKDAYKFKFSSEERYLGINEIEILDLDSDFTREIKDITLSTKNYCQELSWNNSNNIPKTLILYDDKYIGITHDTIFNDFILPTDNLGKNFKLIPLNSNNQINNVFEFNSLTPKVTFYTDLKDKEKEKLLFSSTGGFIGRVNLYSNENIIGKTLSVTLYGFSVYVKNSNGENIPFLNAETGQEVNYLTSGDYAKLKTVKLIIPKEFSYLCFSQNISGKGISNVYIVEEDKQNELRKIESWVVSHKSYITWEGFSKNVSVYYDNEFVGVASNNHFEYTPPYDNLGKEFKLIPINENNISSKIYTFKSNIPESIFTTNLSNKISESLIFDNNDATIAAPVSLKWNIDLTGRKIRILTKGYNIIIHDENNKILSFMDLNKGEMVKSIYGGSYSEQCDAKFIMPPNAKYIEFYGNPNSKGIASVEIID